MKQTNTAERIKEIMKSRNLRQVDILEKAKPYCEKYKVKMNKSDLSQYIAGLVEPGQDKLTILGKALGVSEVWLMGYDVPMTADSEEDDSVTLSESEQELLYKYRFIDNKGKHTVNTVLKMEYNRCKQNIYEQIKSEGSATIETIAAHTDVELTEEELALMKQDADEL